MPDMNHQAYIPEENLFGITTVVTDKSRMNLPSDTTREHETNLPPGAATPMTVRQPDTADGNGRVLAEHGPSYNTPSTNEPGPFEHPRTLGVPGAQEGSPTKFDYNMPTRRTMTSVDKEAYKPRIPWRRQRRQEVWDRLDSKRDYQLNKSKIKHRVKRWYKKIHKNRQFLTKKEDRRNNPKKYERRRIAADTMVIEAYTPTSISTRRRRQHGPARMKSHRNYIRNRAKARRRQHIWYQRNKNKPAFKRRQTMRRQHPQRFRLRPGAYVPGPGIGFVYGPNMTLGQVDSVSADAVVFSPVRGGDPFNPVVLTPAAFLHAVVFDSPESMRMMFAVLDDEIGLAAYDDLTADDIDDIADQYGVAPFELVSDDPDYLSSVASQIVGEAMAAWDDPSPMAVRVATRYLDALGEVILYDQGRPTSHDQAKVVERVVLPHEPTPGGDEEHEESGVSAPASSGKVIPDSMKYAGFREVERLGDLRAYWEYNSPSERYYGVDAYGIVVGGIHWSRKSDSWVVLFLPDGEDGPKVRVEMFTSSDPREGVVRALHALRPKTRSAAIFSNIDKYASMSPERLFKGLRTPESDFDLGLWPGEERGYSTTWYLGWWDYEWDMMGGVIGEDGDHRDPEIAIAERVALANGAERVPDRLGMPRLEWESKTKAVKAAQQIIREIQAYRRSHSKTAATMADLTNRTSGEVTKRSKGVQVRLSRADPSKGIWTFKARGSGGKTYTIRLKAESKGNVKEVQKAQIRVSCDCDFFRWQGPEHWARTNGYLYGKPRGTASAPTKKDVSGEHWICKHVYAAIVAAKHYRIANYAFSECVVDDGSETDPGNLWKGE